MEENKIKENTYRKGLIIIIILLMLLVFTSIVLAQTLYGTVAGNSFTLGTIKIDIGYYVDVKDEEGNITETIGPLWTKNYESDEQRKLIENNALIKNDPEDKTDSDETFGSARDGEDELNHIITRQFSIRNDSNNREYYRLYFTNLSGRLADLINVKIIDVTGLKYDYTDPETENVIEMDFSTHYMYDLDKYEIDENNILFNGVAAEFTKDKVNAFEEILKPGEKRDLLIRFTYPEGGVPSSHDDYTPDKYALAFNLCAEAVQEKNQNTNDIKFN